MGSSFRVLEAKLSLIRAPRESVLRELSRLKLIPPAVFCLRCVCRLLGVPSDFISAIAQATSAQVDSSNNTYIPCSQFPSFGVQFGGKNHVLNLDDLVVHIVDAANISWCQTAFTDIELKDGNNSVILLGDTFMKDYYTVSASSF